VRNIGESDYHSLAQDLSQLVGWKDMNAIVLRGSTHSGPSTLLLPKTGRSLTEIRYNSISWRGHDLKRGKYLESAFSSLFSR